MTRSIINDIVSGPPAAGGSISVIQLDGTRSIELRELYAGAGRVARHLADLGIGAGDRIGILAANSLEWVLLDLAALRVKAVTAGLVSTRFEPGDALCERYGLKLLYTDGPPAGAAVRSLAEIAAIAERGDEDAAPAPVSYAPDDVTTLKFTSGTTGPAKALHASVGSIDSSLRAVQQMFAHGPGDDLFVFLPLSLLQQRYWIYSALRFGHDVSVSTYEAAFAALRRAQPTVVMGVPAFYESARRHIEAQAGRTANDGASGDAVRAAARRLFGERIRYLWTGSAPATIATLRFFTDAGLPIYEGYGTNETCIVSKNHPGASRSGSAGRVLPGKRVLVDADGVVSVRSDHPVSRRYEYAAPGDSERVFGDDGTVRTGDIGYVDDDGFLFIRGRADDVIVLDSGYKIVVRPIEEHLKTSPAIDECVVLCPSQTHLVAVVSPAQQPADTAAIASQLALTNAAFGADEQIRKVVVARPFSVEEQLLTSQLKPHRGRILDAYRTQITDRHGGIHA